MIKGRTYLLTYLLTDRRTCHQLKGLHSTTNVVLSAHNNTPDGFRRLLSEKWDFVYDQQNVVKHSTDVINTYFLNTD